MGLPIEYNCVVDYYDPVSGVPAPGVPPLETNVKARQLRTWLSYTPVTAFTTHRLLFRLATDPGYLFANGRPVQEGDYFVLTVNGFHYVLLVQDTGVIHDNAGEPWYTYSVCYPWGIYAD